MHRRHRAVHRQLLSDLVQRQIGLGGHQRREFVPILRQDSGFPARVAMPVPKFVGFAPLLQEFLYHTQRYAKPTGDLLPRAFLPIIRSHDPFPQIQRQGFSSLTR